MSELLTAEELAKALPLPSANSVNNLRRKRVLPALKLGYRTFRYDLERCRAAISKREIKAIS